MRLPTLKRKQPRRQSNARRGSLTVELLLVLPILFTLLMAMVQLSMMITASQYLTAASREGARVAALGGNPEDVEQAVLRSLSTTALADPNVLSIEVRATDSAGQPVASGEPVEVLVRVPAAHAVPDLLRFIGYSIRDEELVGRTVMRKE